MKRLIIPLLTGLVLAYLIQSCSDSGTQPPPEGPDTTLVSYADEIQPIFTENCALSGCHVGASPKNGLNLTDYDSVMTTGIHAPVVIAFDPDSSYLVKKLRGTATEGSQMPLGGQIEPADSVAIIQWIAEGALDN